MGRYSNPNIVTRLKRVLSGQGQDRVSHRPVPSLPTNRTRIDAEAGETLHALANRLGIERGLIADLLRERGVAMKCRLVDAVDIEAATDLYTSGLSLAKVGEHFGVSAWSVLRAFRSSGVPTRKPRRSP